MTDPLSLPPTLAPASPPPTVEVGAITDPLPLRFTGVYRWAEPAAGPAGGPGFQLDFDSRGITVTGGDGQVAWSAPWEDISGLGTPERSDLSDGGIGVVVAVATRSSRQRAGWAGSSEGMTAGPAEVQRFVLPTTQPSNVEEVLEALAQCQGLTAPLERSMGESAPAGPSTITPRFESLTADGLAIEPGWSDSVNEPGPADTVVAPPGPVGTLVEAVDQTGQPVTGWPVTRLVTEAGPSDTPGSAWAPVETPAVTQSTAVGRPTRLEKDSQGEESSASLLLVIPTVVGSGAVVALLLLAAGHVIHW